MNATPLVVVGSGGFGRELLTWWLDFPSFGKQWDLLGCASLEADLELLRELKCAWLGGDVRAIEIASGAHFSIAIADPRLRQRLVQQYLGGGLHPATLIHPTAQIGKTVTVGEGTIVSSGVRATTNVAVGRYVQIDRGAEIGHDSVLGDYSVVHPRAVVSGGAQLGTGVMVGSNATVLPHVKIGASARIGAGAVVTRNVPAGTTVSGVPARAHHERVQRAVQPNFDT